MAVYGYARCSTNESKQDIDRQKKELIERGVEREKIFLEYASGTKSDRVEFNRLAIVDLPEPYGPTSAVVVPCLYQV